MMEKAGSKRKGFTLLEVMLSMVIFAFISIGISQSLIQTRSIAETNIREVTAYAVASGYLEQMKSIPYQHLLQSVRDPSIPVPTILNATEPDPLMIDEWMEKTIVIDEDAQTGTKRTMPLHVRLEMEDLEASGFGESLSILVFFAWEDAKSRKQHHRSLRTIRSHVRSGT